MSWAVVALVALTATVTISALSATNQAARESDMTAQNVAWTYAGCFTMTAIAWGLFNIIHDWWFYGQGYGDGDIF